MVDYENQVLYKRDAYASLHQEPIGICSFSV